MMPIKNRVIAITGGIATGKSSVGEYLRARGYKVVDFDKIGHSLLKEPKFVEKLKNEIGDEIVVKGAIDRKRLGDLVFSSPELLDKLNNILHPAIYNQAENIISDNKNEKILFLEIPILFETKNKFLDFYKLVDEIWVVTTSPNNQLSRLMKRDGLTRKKAIDRIDSQMDIKDKERMADVVLMNVGEINSLYKNIDIELDRVKNEI